MAGTDIKIKYLLGIDGGGTKTEFLLCHTNGDKIKRIVLGPSNPVNIGIEKTKNLLATGIEDVCKNIDKSEISLFAGIAGGISADNKKHINEFLSSFGFGRYDNAGDTDSALEVTLKGEDGVAIIIGTGVIAFCRKNNTRKRISGWGYLIDKGGSGFHFGSDAIQSALKFIDGRGGSEKILNLIEEKLEKPLPDAIGEIYEKGPSFVASFAPIVFSAFEEGDRYAEEILNRNAKEIAEIIVAGKMFCPDGKVILCGGLCKQSKILREFISNHLDEKINFEFCEEPVINGAVSLAKKLINQKEV